AASPGRAERQIEDGAQMVLELAGLCALDGPVTGVVDAGSHLVGDQASGAHEELDGQNASVTKLLQDTHEMAGGEALPARRSVRGTGETQDSLRVNVAVQRVDRNLAATAAGADDRHLAVE